MMIRKVSLIAVLLFYIVIIERGNAKKEETVIFDAPEDKRNIIEVVHEDLNIDSIFKVSSNIRMLKAGGGGSSGSGSNNNGNGNKEYDIEFDAFGTNHKVHLRTPQDDPELASAFGSKYVAYTLKKDKNTGKSKMVKLTDSLGDDSTIKACIYKGERETSGIAVYIACQGIEYLLISNVDGNNNEQIEVVKDKKTGKMKASKTTFTNLRHIDNVDGPRQNQRRESNDDGDDVGRRQLATNECTLYPQKYVSLVVVNSVSRVTKFGSNAATEADTVAQFLLGKVSYDRTTTPLGCNVKVRLAGQLFETSLGNKIIKEPFCSEVDPKLAAIQTSHNANSGTNGCCSTFPIVWANCPTGETKCWNANAPSGPSGWTTAAPHPVPGVDFTIIGGCYSYQSYGTWYTSGKSVSYFGMGNPYLISNDPTQISHNLYLEYTSAYFTANAATLRTTFGDVDNVQGWTQNTMHSGVAGLGWVGAQCNDAASNAVVSAKYGVYVWLHELGHNLGMNHQTNGIMGRRRLGEKRRELIEFFAPESEADLENFLINKYGVNGGVRCLDNNPPTVNPTPRPTLRPDFVPTNMPTAGNGGLCDPYVCGGSNCGTGNSCWLNGKCYNWSGVAAYQNCASTVCNPGLSCHPDTKICIPCSTTASPTFKYIPGGGIGDKCNANECGASTCDPNLTCDSDGICKVPGKVAVGSICRQDFCLQGLTCNPITDICTACPPTSSPTAGTPTTQPPTLPTQSPTPMVTSSTTFSPTTQSPTAPSQSPTTLKPTTLKPTTKAPTAPTNSPVVSKTYYNQHNILYMSNNNLNIYSIFRSMISCALLFLDCRIYNLCFLCG